MFHDDAGAAVDFGDLVNFADVGVVERRRRPGFAVQSLARGGVRLERFGQELDGDLAPELGVVGQEHFAHSALAELPEDTVAGGGTHGVRLLAHRASPEGWHF